MDSGHEGGWHGFMNLTKPNLESCHEQSCFSIASVGVQAIPPVAVLDGSDTSGQLFWQALVPNARKVIESLHTKDFLDSWQGGALCKNKSS